MTSIQRWGRKALGLVRRAEGAPSQGNFEKYSGQNKFSHGRCEMDDRVVQPGDLVLVMAEEDETDLLKWCTAVTFALQTKPWMREVDLWKSFINVDLGFLEGLDKHWLD